MANEPKVPEVRDDDPEDVSDKLAIAAAMWGRGDRSDAVTWIRRAAEAASDAEQDMRALELAKAASELATLGQSSQSAVPAAAATPAPEPPPSSSRPGSAAPPGPPPKPSKAPPAKPSVVPTAPGRAPAAAAAMPKKPPGSKLPPLPPLRPLGSAPSTPASPPKAPRLPSMITSATGAASASGMVSRDETPAPPEPKVMPWDDPSSALVDDEPTKQIDLGEPPAPPMDLEATREIAALAMQPVRVEKPEPTPAAAELPLAVGVRVRVLVAGDGVHVLPEGETTEGISAVIVPLDANDDLRALFQRRA